MLALASLSLVHGLVCRPFASSPRHESALMQTKAPSKLVTCARCKATFEVDEADFATGRQVRCGGTGCDHEWFQTADRLQTLPNGMELVEYPQEMKDRITAGKSAEPVGRFNIFVGNLAYSVAEDDLREVFEGIGSVAKVIIMTDDDGRPRGFGFVNMEEEAAGARAVMELDGYELQGRSITVSEGKQSEPPRTYIPVHLHAPPLPA